MNDSRPDFDRRAFVGAMALAGAGLATRDRRSGDADRAIVDDVSQLNPVSVAREIRPMSVDELQQGIRNWPGAIFIGGGRFSMGGQIAAPDSLHLDMRTLNRVVAYKPAERVIRVQAGITWRSIQEVIDPNDQSVQIMQSYAKFTVGGSVSVNCHGRYVGLGAVVNSVRALQLVLPDGSMVEASREENSGIFRAAIGGYGGIGIITEVELDLAINERLERQVTLVALDDYPDWFRSEVLGNEAMVMHNADLTPPDFDEPMAVSWLRTEKPLTEPQRLIPRGLGYAKERRALWAITELPGGDSIRRAVDKSRYEAPSVVWRNFEASLDVASLEPGTRVFSTYVLQEYFIPVARFGAFAADMKRILQRHKTGALNVSIRYAPADTTTLLPWAPVDVFCFVLYYKQRATVSASLRVAAWTRALVDAAIRQGGRYYLPYRLNATRDQFSRAYPEAAAFVVLKQKLDPRNRLRNLLWDHYLRRT